MTASQDITSCFNRVYDSTHKAVHAYMVAKCGNLEDVSDIFQETYLELYQFIQKKGGGSFAATNSEAGWRPQATADRGNGD